MGHLILRVTIKLLFAPIMLFAFYVQFHGDYSPGGGFQAGVIFSSGFILYILIFGLETAETILPPRLLRVVASLGVLVYAGTGMASLFMGGEFLNYSALADSPTTGQHMGIILVELGVGMTVSAIILLIFFTFANRGRV